MSFVIRVHLISEQNKGGVYQYTNINYKIFNKKYNGNKTNIVCKAKGK
jgi:hypothetical protein